MLLLDCRPAADAAIGSGERSGAAATREAPLAGDADAVVVAAAVNGSACADCAAAVVADQFSAGHDDGFPERIGAGGAPARNRPCAVEISAATTSAATP